MRLGSENMPNCKNFFADIRFIMMKILGDAVTNYRSTHSIRNANITTLYECISNGSEPSIFYQRYYKVLFYKRIKTSRNLDRNITKLKNACKIWHDLYEACEKLKIEGGGDDVKYIVLCAVPEKLQTPQKIN